MARYKTRRRHGGVRQRRAPSEKRIRPSKSGNREAKRKAKRAVVVARDEAWYAKMETPEGEEKIYRIAKASSEC